MTDSFMMGGIGFGTGMDWAIRPFQRRDDVLQRYIDARPAEAEDADANIRWGAKSTFGFLKGPWAVGPVVTIIYPPVDEDADEEEEQTEEWQEVDREETEERRVENPDDSEQYVMVKDAQWVRFRRADNTLVRLNFNPPSE